eukprot:scaffold489115_cov48-Prasinocladus_malaysianus.AAC.1
MHRHTHIHIKQGKRLSKRERHELLTVVVSQVGGLEAYALHGARELRSDAVANLKGLVHKDVHAGKYVLEDRAGRHGGHNAAHAEAGHQRGELQACVLADHHARHDGPDAFHLRESHQVHSVTDSVTG